MAKLEFTAEARADLRAIVAYTVRTWSAEQARRYVDGLKALCERLARTPKIGRAAPDLGEALRCFPYESHVLYYRALEDGIVVLAVVHKRQNPALRLED